MIDLKQKHEAAKIALAASLVVLEAEKTAYHGGPAKDYAAVKQNKSSLQLAIEEQEAASLAAKRLLTTAMREANGAQTADVKDALMRRRNADDLLDQYRELMAGIETASTEAHIAASDAVGVYANAYENASKCWAELNLYAVLLDCGERIARAMSVKPLDHVLSPGYTISSLAAAEPYREKMIHALDELCVVYGNDTRPYVGEIGKLDLGPLMASDVLTPGGKLLARRRLEQAQIPTAIA